MRWSSPPHGPQLHHWTADLCTCPSQVVLSPASHGPCLAGLPATSLTDYPYGGGQEVTKNPGTTLSSRSTPSFLRLGLSNFLRISSETLMPTPSSRGQGLSPSSRGTHQLETEVFPCFRIAQRQCCISYLKEKSCVAGVVGAKEGETCGAEDNDTCGVSLYKASPTGCNHG